MPSPGPTPPPSTPPSRFVRTAAAALLAAGLGGLVPIAVAAPAERVADIHAGPITAGTNHWLWEGDFEPLGGQVYFTTDDGIHGNELWVTDGTSAGTALVADICPGVCPSNPIELTAAGDRLYFSAHDGSHGTELWVSDGTTAATTMVADLRPGLGSSRPTRLFAFGDGVVFAAAADDSLTGLWHSDGTAGGTVRLGDPDPAAAPGGPVPLAVIDGDLLLSAADVAHGRELWLTDGTPGGTALLADIRSGAQGSHSIASTLEGFRPYAATGGRLYLIADDGVHGRELWSSDGTPGGTAMVVDLYPGPQEPGLQSLAAFDGRVFFRADTDGWDGELWVSDGTPAGTQRVIDGRPGPEGSYPSELIPAGSSLFFFADDGVHGRELWVSDGTEAGTGMVADLLPGAGETWLFFHGIAPLGDGVVSFFADDGTTGPEPWVSDGTAGGTFRLADIYPGPFGSFVPFFAIGLDRREVVDGEWYFRALGPVAGVELWISDGTAAGTRTIDINHQSSAFSILSHTGNSALWGPAAIAGHGGDVFLQADDGLHGSELWRTDGTAAGTALVLDLVPGEIPSRPQAIRSAEHGVILSATTTECCGTRAWVSDGTPAGTLPAAGTVPGAEFAARLKGAVYFTGYRGGLWRTDGTIAGTEELLADVDSEGGVARLGKWIYFAGGSNEPYPGVSELWRTDGATVEPVADIVPGPAGSQPRSLIAGESLLFFSADDGAHGRELWVSDGAAAGTVLSRDIRPGPESGIPGYTNFDLFGEIAAVAAGDKAFFLADDGVAGEEPWVSDGTEAGTFLLRDVFPGARSSEILWLTSAGKRVYFVAEDGAHGRELWTSDGTPAGTALVADLVPGPGSSLPDQLAAAEGRLYFTAHTPAHGREPWVSDGTAAGTVRLDDIAPGPLPSSPLSFTRAGDWLYFAATDAVSGFELWRLPLVDGTEPTKGNVKKE